VSAINFMFLIETFIVRTFIVWNWYYRVFEIRVSDIGDFYTFQFLR